MKHKTTTKIALCGGMALLMGREIPAQAVINLSSTKQTIDGFGGMNFPRWQPGLNDSNGINMADKAFGTEQGKLGLSILRINLGIDTASWPLELFATKAAQAHGVKIFTSEWSTPLAMKDGGKLVGGHLKASSYGEYAAFTNKFIGYMKKNGVDIYAASVTNEPDCPVMYETTEWTATEVTNFVKNNGASINAKLMAAETFQFNKSYSDMILNDAAAAANLDIVAAHPYGISNIASVMAYPLAAQKGKALWMTEHYTGQSSTSANQWPDALDAAKEVHAFMVINYNAYVWWYIRRSYGLITDDGMVSKRGYAFSHFSRFVRPGFVRVDAPVSPTNGLLITAYKKDDDVVVVIINSNNSTTSQAFSLTNGTATIPSFKKFTTSSSKSQAEDAAGVTVTNKAFTVSLDAQSVTTLVYTAPTAAIGDSKEVSTPIELANAVGEYQVFDVTGAKIGSVNVAAGQALPTELQKIVPESGFYLAKATQGNQSFRVNVSVR